ncbi:MAG: putative metal-dependent TIM-barrel fold hydrolase [Bradymonadia bacterium]|jgi:predicted metal-dependent TIM-barrel fold hydrolase
MQIFNTLLDATDANDAELANRAHFGLRHALVVRRLRERPDLASELIAHWDEACEETPSWLSSWGISAGVCLGVTEASEPVRAHDVVWDALEHRASLDAVWALGPVSVGSGATDASRRKQTHLASRMFELAAGSSRPVIADVSGLASRAEVGQVLTEAHAAGLDPARLVVSGVDFTSVRAVLDAGAHACALVGAGETESVTQLVVRFGERARKRLMIGTAGALGRPDVLALPKLAAALTSQGLGEDEVAAVLYKNAFRLFVRGT